MRYVFWIQVGLSESVHPIRAIHAPGSSEGQMVPKQEIPSEEIQVPSEGILLYDQKPNCLSRLFADVSQNTTVDVQHVAVDEVGSVGSQEYGRSHQIFRCSPAGSRCLGYDEGIERMA